MRYWIEPRWPDRRASLDRLYFHCGKRKTAEKMCVGDRVLLYETKRKNPDTHEQGRGRIFGLGVVAGELQRLPAGDPDRRIVGERKWNLVRAFKLGTHIPLDQKQLGLSLPRIREILGRKPGWAIRTTTKITKEKFDELAAELQ